MDYDLMNHINFACDMQKRDFFSLAPLFRLISIRKALTAYMGTFPITAVVLEQKRQFYNRGAKVNKDRLNFFFFSISVLIYPYQLTPHCEVFFFLLTPIRFLVVFTVCFFTWRHFRVYERKTNRVQFIYFRGHNSRLMFHRETIHYSGDTM